MTGDPYVDALLNAPRSFGSFKTAASRGDMLRLGMSGLRDSLVGTHGLKGWMPALKEPGKHIWKGFKDTGLFMPLVALGIGSAALQEGGPFTRAGRVAGQVLPMGLMGLGKKGPGLIGSTVLQEGLGGGMFVDEGMLGRAGKTIDKTLGLGPKVTAPDTTAGQFSQFGVGSEQDHQRINQANRLADWAGSPQLKYLR